MTLRSILKYLFLASITWLTLSGCGNEEELGSNEPLSFENPKERTDSVELISAKEKEELDLAAEQSSNFSFHRIYHSYRTPFHNYAFDSLHRFSHPFYRYPFYIYPFFSFEDDDGLPFRNWYNDL